MLDQQAINRLIETASRLKSECGENPEYDRALCELIAYHSSSLNGEDTQERIKETAKLIGIVDSDEETIKTTTLRGISKLNPDTHSFMFLVRYATEKGIDVDQELTLEKIKHLVPVDYLYWKKFLKDNGISDKKYYYKLVSESGHHKVGEGVDVIIVGENKEQPYNNNIVCFTSHNKLLKCYSINEGFGLNLDEKGRIVAEPSIRK